MLRRVGGSCTLLWFVLLRGPLLVAQDGVGANERAKAYHAPVGSVAGADDTPERLQAIGLLLGGDTSRGIAALTELAEGGDVPSALFLAGIYSENTSFPIAVDPAKALRLYRLASAKGSGEGSERIAEMVERQEVAVPTEGGAEYWRSLAWRQGWTEQRLTTDCFDWIHGPEPLHCDPLTTPGVEPPSPECPDEEAMRRLRVGGVTGAIRLDGGVNSDAHGPQATAIVLVDHVVPKEVDLQEPDAGTVIYVQQADDRWRMLPVDAPLLARYLILAPAPDDARSMSFMSQGVDGAQSGSGCGWFVPMTREEGKGS